MRIETLPVDKIFVSDLNIRADEKFGEGPEDEALRENVRREGVKQPITVRPNGGKYEVILGRRRFLSSKANGVKKVECVVRDDWDDREALKASLIENWPEYQKTLDPITKAEALNRLVAMSTKDMQTVANEMRIPKSTFSEHISLLKLSPNLKELVRRKVIPLKEAVQIARLKLGEDSQNSLAELVVSKGLDTLRNEIERLKFGKKRGAPVGLLVIRLTFDHRSMEQRSHYESLMKLGGPKYCKDILVERLKKKA